MQMVRYYVHIVNHRHNVITIPFTPIELCLFAVQLSFIKDKALLKH